MTPRKIVFAYRPRQKSMGGKIMRVDQLMDILARELPEDRYVLEKASVPKAKQTEAFAAFQKACAGAVVIFHKSAVVNLDAETRAKLKAVAAGICIDHLDFVVQPLERGFVDIHISASRVGEAEMRRNLIGLNPGPNTLVRHLRHHADPRLGAEQVNGLGALVPGYFGAAIHLEDASALPTDAIVPDYNPKETGEFMKSLAASNFHLCVRDPSVGPRFGVTSTKPFTKGFNAAAVGANILVNRQVHDAEYYLGSDYPFMIDGFSADDISSGMETARAAFGGKIWRDGLDRMRAMSAQVAPAAIAKEFRDIVDLFN